MDCSARNDRRIDGVFLPQDASHGLSHHGQSRGQRGRGPGDLCPVLDEPGAAEGAQIFCKMAVPTLKHLSLKVILEPVEIADKSQFVRKLFDVVLT